MDGYGAAVPLEEFGKVIAKGGSAVEIASQSGHRLGALSAEQDKLLAPAMLQPDQDGGVTTAYRFGALAPA